MLPIPVEESISSLTAPSAKHTIICGNVVGSRNNSSHNLWRMEQDGSKTNTTRKEAVAAHHPATKIAPGGRRSNFVTTTATTSFSKQHGGDNRSFCSLNNGAVAVRNHGRKLYTVNNNRGSMPTTNIVNQALEVMMNPSKEPQDSSGSGSNTSNDSDDSPTEEDSSEGTDRTPSDSSNTTDSDRDDDDDVEAPSDPILGNLTAQLSFRKIAKKRRKANGRSSFHHTKSSKEYLRKTQEAYQKLKINEQEKQNDGPVRRQQKESRSGKDCNEEGNSSSGAFSAASEPIDYGYADPSDSQPKITAAVDYGCVNPSDNGQPENNKAVDYGYGNPSDSQPNDGPVDYGYGDPSDSQQQPVRRGRRARRRNSVTKFSLEAANIVAAKAAAERILQLKSSLAFLPRKNSLTPTRRISLVKDQQPKQQRSSRTPKVGRSMDNVNRVESLYAMTTTMLRKEEEKNKDDTRKNLASAVLDRYLDPVTRSSPRSSPRSSRHFRDGSWDTGSASVSEDLSRILKASKPLQKQQPTTRDDDFTPLPACPHFRFTSDSFSSDAMPRSLLRKKSFRTASNNVSIRFNTPIRTESWLSNDNSFSTLNNDDDNDDADSLASDMESLCSIRDGNYRLDGLHNSLTFKNSDLPPVQPAPPPASPLVLMSQAILASPGVMRKPLVVSFSNGSNKEGSRFGSTDKHRARQNGGGAASEYPIVPFPGAVTVGERGSKSSMPAPVNRTPSYNGSHQR